MIKMKIFKGRKNQNSRSNKSMTAEHLMKGKKEGKIFLTKEGEKLLNKWS
ncbi:hypothetical protein [Evansella cellulosilytica]|nr:hypothetical protein [Evansella cellulosilytica]